MIPKSMFPNLGQFGTCSQILHIFFLVSSLIKVRITWRKSKQSKRRIDSDSDKIVTEPEASKKRKIKYIDEENRHPSLPGMINANELVDLDDKVVLENNRDTQKDIVMQSWGSKDT